MINMMYLVLTALLALNVSAEILKAFHLVESSMERAGDHAGAEKLGKRMEGMAGGLHRDPQFESVLRARAPELALNMERGRSIGQELAQSVSIGRDRDRGMSR